MKKDLEIAKDELRKGGGFEQGKVFEAYFAAAMAIRNGLLSEMKEPKNERVVRAINQLFDLSSSTTFSDMGIEEAIFAMDFLLESHQLKPPLMLRLKHYAEGVRRRLERKGREEAFRRPFCA